jgi:CRP-like cAMP-binding protein
VKEGAVKLTVVNKSGKEAVIALVGAGDFVEEACISGGARSAAHENSSNHPR